MKKILLVSISLLLVPCFAHGATLYFDPQDHTVGIGQPFSVGLLVDASLPDNAFDVKIHIPDGLEMLDTLDGNSIIDYWITKPTFDEKSRVLSFSGITPGGFSGKGGRLLVMSMKADQLGSFSLDYDPSTAIIHNDQNHSPDIVETTPIILTAEQGKNNVDNKIPDTDPPGSFTPSVATSSVVFGGKWAIYFQAQDKGSGMAGYEVAESRLKTADYDSLSWREAESPDLLSDQNLSSYIYVKAMDKDGNSRVEVIAPANPGAPWPMTGSWFIIYLIALILGALVISWLSHKK
jgi:hypothetical protein